jgi:acyl-CoA dehydrogenase
MIIFGQGAIRCHPYAYKEVIALNNHDTESFDRAFTSHIGHVIQNLCRSVVLSWTRGRVGVVPAQSSPEMKRYYQKLMWASAAFAFWADVAMGTLGGKLKQKESITGRFADILSWMYLISAALRRFEAEGRQPAHGPFVHFAVRHGFHQIQQAFDGLFQNFEVPILAPLLRCLVAPWARLNSFASPAPDATAHTMVASLMQPGALRDALTLRGIYVPKDPSEALGRLERAFQLSVSAQAVIHKISAAIKQGVLPKGKPAKAIDAALKAQVITQAEASLWQQAQEAAEDAIQVDAYALQDYGAGVVNLKTLE